VSSILSFRSGVSGRVGRHFAHQERELLGNVDAGEIPVGHVGLAVREGEDDIEDPADAVETGRACLDGAQRAAAAVRLCRRGIDRRVACRQIVEGAVLVGGAGMSAICMMAPSTSSATGVNSASGTRSGRGIAFTKPSISKE
jgi:hypothetical protein